VTPTARSLYLIFAWGLFGFAASVRSDWQLAWAMAGGVALLILLVDAVFLRLSSKFELTRQLPGRFAVGEGGEVRLDFVNRSGRTLDVEIYDGIPEGVESKIMPWNFLEHAKNVQKANLVTFFIGRVYCLLFYF